MPISNPERRDTASAFMLCMACGIADAVGFIHSGVFAANMTGNTVLAALSLASGNWHAAFERAMALVAFFAGAMVSRLLLQLSRQRVWVPLLLEGALLCAAAFMDPKHSYSIWVIAVAMGVQAAAIVKFRGAAISTVVITSTMVRLAESSVDALSGLARSTAYKPGIPTSLLLLTWLSYGVGAALAVPLAAATNLSLLLPAAIVWVVACLWSKTSHA